MTPPTGRSLHSGRWTSTSSGRSPLRPSAPPSTRCSGPPTRAGPAARGTPRVDGHAAHGGHATRARRDLLLPALHAVQARIGWISQPALNYICRRLTVAPAEAYGVATFYALFATTRTPADRRPRLRRHRLPAGRRRARCARTWDGRSDRRATRLRDGRSTWLRSPCLGLCERAPAALVTAAGEQPGTARRSRRSTPSAVLEPARPADRRTAPPRPRRRRCAALSRRRPAGPAPAPARREGRSDLPRRLPGARWLRRRWRGRSSSGPEGVIAEVTEPRS